MGQDSASDWWNFGVNVVIAIATVLAVWFSVVTARRARKDQELEAGRRRQAEAELLAEQRADAQERLRAAAELEAVRQEGAAESRRFQRELEVTRMAERQAMFVRPVGHWATGGDGGGFISGDLHSPVYLEVINGSDAPITDISYRFDRWFGPAGTAGEPNSMDKTEFSLPFERILPRESQQFRPAMSYVFGHDWGDDLGFTIRFTDQYGDSWEMSPDGSLKLRVSRKITAEA